MSTRYLLPGVIGVVAGACGCEARTPPPHYRAEVLGEVEEGGRLTRFIGLTNSGHVVGQTNRQGQRARGWIWDGRSQPTWLEPPANLPNAAMYLYSVSTDGVVAGEVFDFVTQTTWACIWRNGQAELLAQYDPQWQSIAFSANNAGDAVGTSGVGVVWRDGVPTPVKPLPGETAAGPLVINNAGMIGGYGGHAIARWVDGVGTALEIPKDVAGYSEPLSMSMVDMNDSGTIIGTTSFLNGGTRAFAWPGNEPVDLGALEDPLDDTPDVSPLAINGSGWALLSQWSESYFGANLLSINGVCYQIDGLLDDALEGFQAIDINDSGQILGSVYAGGKPVPVLLTPVPAPGASVAFVTVGGWALAYRRRRRPA